MNQEKRFVVDILFVLALFGVFAVSALMLVTIGADVYQHTVSDMSSNYETRTAVSYITEKIRQNDTLSGGHDSTAISTLSGEPALVLTQDVDGEIYCTYLYHYNGYLKELFMKKGNSVGGNVLEAGTDIMPLSELKMEAVADDLLSFHIITPDGDAHQIYVSTHCNADE